MPEDPKEWARCEPGPEAEALDSALAERVCALLGERFDDYIVVVRSTSKDRRLSARWSNVEWAAGAVVTISELVDMRRKAGG